MAYEMLVGEPTSQARFAGHRYDFGADFVPRQASPDGSLGNI